MVYISSVVFFFFFFMSIGHRCVFGAQIFAGKILPQIKLSDINIYHLKNEKEKRAFFE